MNKSLLTEVKTTVACQIKKLGAKFQLRNKTKFYQQNNLFCYRNCSDEFSNKSYVGETYRRIWERIIEHRNRGKTLHLLKTSREKNY